MTKRTIFQSGAMLCTMTLLFGCAAQDGQDSTSVQQEKTKLPMSAFGVLPVQVSLPDDVILTEAARKTLDDGATVIDGLLHSSFEKNTKAHFLRADEIGNLQMTGAPIRLEASQNVAEKSGSTALMETTVSRYELRDGGPYGVEQPAAVTLSYRLYDVKSGTVLCQGRFEERQQALMDNLFTFDKVGKRKMTWVTAEELAREGLQEQIAQCPYFAK